MSKAKASRKKEWEGAFTAYKQTYRQITENPQPTVLFVAIYTALTVVSLVLQGKTSYLDTDYTPYADVIVALFALSITAYGLAIADKKSMDIRQFTNVSIVRLAILWVASLLAGLIMFGSALLLLVPLIWTVAWFALCAYPVADSGKGPIEALKESKRLSQDHKSKVWGVIGVSILISVVASILAFIPFVGIAAIAFTIPLTAGAFAHLYRWLQAQA